MGDIIQLFNAQVTNNYEMSTVTWAVVVANLVERSLKIPDVRSSNPVISKNYIEHLLSSVLKRRK